jgi:hypothetical protein
LQEALWSIQFYGEKFSRAKRHPEAANETAIETEIEAAKCKEQGARSGEQGAGIEERGERRREKD